MNRSHLWKLLLLLFVLGWSLYELNPPKGRDVGDVFLEQAARPDGNYSNIVAQLGKLRADFPGRQYGNLRQAIGTNDVTKYLPEFEVAGEKDPTAAILSRLQRRAAGKIKLGLDLQGGSAFVVQMQTNALGTNVVRETLLENAVEVLRKRVDKFGVAEPLIQAVPGQNRIVIQMPGLSEDVKDQVRTAVQKAAVLEFRMVHEESDQLLAQAIVPPGYTRLMESKTLPDGKTVVRPHLVSKQRVEGLSGKNITSSGVIRGNMNDPQIAIEFDGPGAKRFGEMTEQNIGRSMAVILDGELYSAPVIKSAITGGHCVISGGSMTEKDAFSIANILQNPLEAPVEIIQENTVDPVLGRDTIARGITSAVYATIAVALFMLVYYLLAGVVANVALLLNIAILLGVLCGVGATLTLPGIAGIVLTIGMAVDANVLIFERIREELAKGKSLKGSIAAGYDRAFSTILDSNLTTLIASVLLIYLGTGTVRGFGIALTIGVAVSMFTALVVTRLIFDFMLARGMIKSLKMLHLVKATNVDFMKWAKPAFAVSWLLILVGLGYGLGVRGSKWLGTDFAGGDNLTVRFAPGQKIAQEKISATIGKLQIGEGVVQYQNDLAQSGETLRITTKFNTAAQVLTALQRDFPAAQFSELSVDRVGPVMGEEIMQSAVKALLLALFGILIYVAFRYEFSFAVGAVIAIIHDLLMTLGIYGLTGLFGHGRELNATVVAALLTIVGFSINDTIVIFDRIREDLKMGMRGSFRDIINRALNETLSRTIITSGTVFLATLVLYFFGGGAINDFAFTFLAGIITGTYSSIYIASALVLWWHKGEKPKLAAIAVTATQATAPLAAPAKA